MSHDSQQSEPLSVVHFSLPDEEATIAVGQALARATFTPADSDAAVADPASGEGHACVGGALYLQGDLGAGKTTLTRGIMRGFGYQGAVKSPTYTLVEPYEFTQCQIYHFDLYRLADPEEVEYLGTEDYFANNNLCIFEWPERGAGHIPDADLVISLETEGTGRRLTCQSFTKKGEQISQAIAKRLPPAGRNL